jgi:hypothetical protein
MSTQTVGIIFTILSSMVLMFGTYSFYKLNQKGVLPVAISNGRWWKNLIIILFWNLLLVGGILLQKSHQMSRPILQIAMMLMISITFFQLVGSVRLFLKMYKKENAEGISSGFLKTFKKVIVVKTIGLLTVSGFAYFLLEWLKSNNL